jgi:hypothetical protein
MAVHLTSPYTVLALYIFGDILFLVFSALSGSLPYPVAIIQAIILVPLIVVFYYFRRRRTKTVGADFNILVSPLSQTCHSTSNFFGFFWILGIFFLSHRPIYMRGDFLPSRMSSEIT